LLEVHEAGPGGRIKGLQGDQMFREKIAQLPQKLQNTLGCWATPVTLFIGHILE